MTDRRGFGFVDVLVLGLLGTLLVLGTLQVLITNRRAYAAGDAEATTPGELRRALQPLAEELRAVSPRDGDILAGDASGITFRRMTDFGTVCDVSGGPTQRLTVRASADAFAGGGPVLVFADGDDATSADDAWLTLRPAAAAEPVECPTGAAGKLLSFTGSADGAALASHSIRPGAPVRGFSVDRWSAALHSGRYYVERRRDGGPAVRVAGPIPADVGGAGPLVFRYLDGAGQAISDLADVRRIEVVWRSGPDSGEGVGAVSADSLLVRVAARN